MQPSRTYFQIHILVYLHENDALSVILIFITNLLAQTQTSHQTTPNFNIWH